MTDPEKAYEVVHLLNDVAERIAELLPADRGSGLEMLRAGLDLYRRDTGSRPAVLPYWLEEELHRGLPRGRPPRGGRR